MEYRVFPALLERTAPRQRLVDRMWPLHRQRRAILEAAAANGDETLDNQQSGHGRDVRNSLPLMPATFSIRFAPKPSGFAGRMLLRLCSAGRFDKGLNLTEPVLGNKRKVVDDENREAGRCRDRAVPARLAPCLRIQHTQPDNPPDSA